MFISILFYFFAAMTLCGALLVVTSRHPVRAVLSLVLTFVGAAATWMLIEAEFLALTLIVVYVGAVMVMFLFVVMMLDVDIAEMKAQFVKFWFIPVLMGLALCGMFYFVLGPAYEAGVTTATSIPKAADYSHIEAIGMALYTHHIWPFELAAVILLAAMLAAIVLTFRGRSPNVKGITPAEQIAVQPEDRLRIIKSADAKGGMS